MKLSKSSDKITQEHIKWLGRRGCLKYIEFAVTLPNHTNNNRSQPHLWSLDVVKAEALKYHSRSLLAFGNRAAYNKARQMRWLDEFFPQ